MFRVKSTWLDPVTIKMIIEVTLATGKILKLQALLEAQIHAGVDITPIFVGGVFNHPSDTPLDLAHSEKHDEQGNSVELIEELAQTLNITLEKHPKVEGKAIWNIAATAEMFMVLWSTFGEFEGHDEIAEILVDRAFPPAMLMQPAQDPTPEGADLKERHSILAGLRSRVALWISKLR